MRSSISSTHCKIHFIVLVLLFDRPSLVPSPLLSPHLWAGVRGTIFTHHITGGGWHYHWLPVGGSVGGTSRGLEGRRREIQAFLLGLLSSSAPPFWQCLHPSRTSAPTEQPIFWAPVLNTVEDHGFLLSLSKAWRMMGLWVPQFPLLVPFILHTLLYIVLSLKYLQNPSCLLVLSRILSDTPCSMQMCCSNNSAIQCLV